MLKELIVKEDPKSPISEIFRTLRTNIQFTNTKNKMKSLLVTSTLAGEGKSWISANLAVTFAQAGKKVIVLDADMRKGRQYRIFGISPRPGLSNFLSGVTENGEEVDLADYVQETEIENLYVIPAGNLPPNPSELLVSETMVKLLENLKAICDIVIIDGPPTQLVTDSLILARMADSTVIVAEGNKTKKENLRRILDNIQKVGGKIAGVVLNKVALSSKKYEQSYYYGSTGVAVNNRYKKDKKYMKNNQNNDNSYMETRNRNTERARQLVNQNRKRDDKIKKEKEEYIEKIIEEPINFEGKEEYKEEIVKEPINFERNQEYNEQEFKNSMMADKKEQPKEQYNESTTNIEINDYNIHDLDEKTRSIIQQVNEYLENERKNLDN